MSMSLRKAKGKEKDTAYEWSDWTWDEQVDWYRTRVAKDGSYVYDYLPTSDTPGYDKQRDYQGVAVSLEDKQEDYQSIASSLEPDKVQNSGSLY